MVVNECICDCVIGVWGKCRLHDVNASDLVLVFRLKDERKEAHDSRRAF